MSITHVWNKHACILPGKMDANMLFAVLGVLLNFQLQSQQSFIVVLVLMVRASLTSIFWTSFGCTSSTSSESPSYRKPTSSRIVVWNKLSRYRNIPGDYFRRKLIPNTYYLIHEMTVLMAKITLLFALPKFGGLWGRTTAPLKYWRNFGNL